MASDTWSLLVAQTWDGLAAPRDQWVQLDVTLTQRCLEVRLDAPFHGDEPPPDPAGAMPGLWNYEVVELFLLGQAERYLELELGPHGHYLALEFCGPRQLVREHGPLDYRARIAGSRFLGRAQVPLEVVPAGLDRVNAYAIHGPPEARQYWALRGAPGVKPDFHRLETFAPLGLAAAPAEVMSTSRRAAGRARAST